MSMDLDMTGGWERICNDPSRKASRRLEKKEQMKVLHQQKLLKCKKKINRVILVAMVAALSIILSATGLLEFWVACFTATVLTNIACFLAGGIWAELKR